MHHRLGYGGVLTMITLIENGLESWGRGFRSLAQEQSQGFEILTAI